MSSSIRPAKSEDAEGIARVKIESWREGYAHILPAEYLANLDLQSQTTRFHADVESGAQILVATVDGLVAGFAWWQELLPAIHSDWPYRNTVASLYIHPDHYRRGWGTALLRACGTLAIEKNHKGMMIGVFRDNERAKALYLKLGATPFKESFFPINGVDYPELILKFENLRSLASPGSGQAAPIQ